MEKLVIARIQLVNKKGVKESVKIIALYNDQTGHIDGRYNNQHIIGIAGESCEIEAELKVRYSVVAKGSPEELEDNTHIFDTNNEAEEYMAIHGGRIFYGGLWIPVNRNESYCNGRTIWGKTTIATIKKIQIITNIMDFKNIDYGKTLFLGRMAQYAGSVLYS